MILSRTPQQYYKIIKAIMSGDKLIYAEEVRAKLGAEIPHELINSACAHSVRTLYGETETYQV